MKFGEKIKTLRKSSIVYEVTMPYNVDENKKNIDIVG